MIYYRYIEIFILTINGDEIKKSKEPPRKNLLPTLILTLLLRILSFSFYSRHIFAIPLLLIPLLYAVSLQDIGDHCSPRLSIQFGCFSLFAKASHPFCHLFTKACLMNGSLSSSITLIPSVLCFLSLPSSTCI